MPITSANLTFKDFLCQINKAMQVKSAENTLEKISGNSLQHSKKRKITFAASSDNTNTTDTYQKPSKYKEPSKYKDFVTQLVSACIKGDDDSKKLMQELVPYLVDTLKLKKAIGKAKSLSFELNKCSRSTFLNESEFQKIHTSENIFDALVSTHLDRESDVSEDIELLGDNNDDNEHALSFTSYCTGKHNGGSM